MDEEFKKWIKKVIEEIQLNIKEMFNTIKGTTGIEGMTSKIKTLEDDMKDQKDFKKKIDGIVWKLALVGLLSIVSLYGIDKLGDKKDRQIFKEVVQQELKNIGRMP